MFILKAIYNSKEHKSEQNYICDEYHKRIDKNGTKVSFMVDKYKEPIELRLGVNEGYTEIYIMNQYGDTIDTIRNGAQN